MLYEINEKALKLESQGKKIIKLNLGDPDMATPNEIIEAAYDSMKRGKTKYSSSYGELPLRKKLGEIHGVSPDNVVITPGSKWGVFSTMFLLLRGGGNVVIPTPYWTAYDLMAKSLGAEVRLLKTELGDCWRIDVEKLEKLIDSNTRMIILNNPNNPTSKVIEDQVLDAIVELANKKGITILSDEVYGTISFVKTKSILDYGQEPHLNHRLLENFHHDRLANRLRRRPKGTHRPHHQVEPDNHKQRPRIHPGSRLEGTGIAETNRDQNQKRVSGKSQTHFQTAQEFGARIHRTRGALLRFPPQTRIGQ